VSLAESMQTLADAIQARTERPVTTDPRAMTALPAVLVEPPTLDMTTATACGVIYRYGVLVVGLPGARTEFGPLSDLMEQVLPALDGWTIAEPVGYVPLAYAGDAEPCQAYRVTVEIMDGADTWQS